jgi:hypothetical protein
MPNVVKYTTDALPSNCLKKGNFAIGNNTGDYGLTFYNGITPPSGGYTIYLNKASGGPSIYCPTNDSQLITITNQIASANYTTAAQCLNYFAGQSDKICVNRDYEGIVTNGLVLNLDAGFIPSYPTTGTTWYDIGPNILNGTLTNGPTFSSANSGSIVFDGTNDYVKISNTVPTSLQIGQNDFTIDFWVYPSNTSAYSICGNLQDSNGTGYYWVIINSTFTGLHTVQFGTEPVPACKFGTTALAANQWYNIILSRTGTSLICYINGSVYGNTVNLPTFNGTTSTEFLIGISKSSGNYSAYPLNGRLANLKIYNQKGFTSAEALQNYNAQKGRYGL